MTNSNNNCVLCYRENTYTNKEGKKVNAKNFFVKIGNSSIPVKVCYFPDKDTQIDKQYSSRMAVMSAVAVPLVFASEEK